MKKKTPRHNSAPVPTLSPALRPEGEEGVGEMCKTTIQGLPGKKPNWRCGAPNGNRNAARPVPPLSAIRRRIRELNRRARALIALAEAAG